MEKHVTSGVLHETCNFALPITKLCILLVIELTCVS